MPAIVALMQAQNGIVGQALLFVEMQGNIAGSSSAIQTVANGTKGAKLIGFF